MPFSYAILYSMFFSFEMPRARTNNIRGERDVRVASGGGTKRGFTVALSATASGHKLPALIIFKEPNGRIPPRILQKMHIPANIKVRATQNGWMTTAEV